MMQETFELYICKFFSTTNIDSLISKFFPYDLKINKNGECALIAENGEDVDQDDAPQLAVVIYPKLSIFTNEEYSEYIYGGGDDDIRKELYGE